MLNSKKGLEGPFWILVVIIALGIFLIIYLGAWRGLFKGEIDIVDRQIKGAEDRDGDGLVDSIDRCACDKDNNEPCNPICT